MALTEITPDGRSLPVPSYPPDPLMFSFFIPCYNEERNVAAVIEKLVRVCTAQNVSFEILVFDDCSRDGTVEVVRACQAAHAGVPVRLFVNSINQGVARNFIEGAFQARGTYYRVVMGDDVESEETLQKIVALAGHAEIVIPYHTVVTGRPLNRKIISRLYTVLVNFAANRRLRYYNGSPLFQRRDALRFHVEATGLGFQAEFLLRLLQEGRTFIEVPVSASDREGSTSLNLRNFVSVGYSIFKIFMRRVSGKRTYIKQ
jgi:glycosyltransferase involved in cell wall biosynthesis